MLSQLISGEIGLWGAVIYVLSTLTVIFLTLPIHEFAHGFTATKLGDPTPRYQGRLTINPFAHIDYVGALCILLFGFGWAKPVEINSNNFKNPKRDMALTAFAGPLSNILLALLSLILINIMGVIFQKTLILPLYYVGFFFMYIAKINISLAVFNLIPIPPLDGSRILFAVLPNKYYFAIMRYERYIYYGLIILMLTGVLSIPLNFLSNLIFNLISVIANLPFGI